MPDRCRPGRTGAGAEGPTAPSAELWNETTEPAIVPKGADRRFLYTSIPTLNAGEATSVADFRITARTTTGTVERALDATTDKSVVDNTIAHVVEELAQHAVIIPDIPNQLLESLTPLRAVLQLEGRLAVEKSIDSHVYSTIATGAPNGSTGADLIAQTRNAVASMRSAGMAPNLLVLDPADAVTLDLIDAGDGTYLFATRDTGSSSPLWGLRVVETVAAVGSDPLLIDTSRVGVLYLGTIRIDADPFYGFRKNLTDLRVETNALCTCAT